MMKTFFSFFIVLLLPVIGISDNTNVLVVTGGHSFEREPFFALFDALEGVNWEEAIQPEANRLMENEQLDDYDVLVFYDMYQEISQEQQAAFLRLLKAGKPMLFLHHALVSYQTWDEFEHIIGGRYFDEKRYPMALENGFSTYLHDTPVPVQIVQDNHPVTKGLADFIIFDEVYGNFRVLPTVIQLLKTTHAESSPIIGWENHYESSTIIYLQPGHDHHAYQDENYRKLIRQAIAYLAEGKK